MYHIIFVCKYHRNALMGFEDSLKDILITIASKSDFDVVEMECDKNNYRIYTQSRLTYRLDGIHPFVSF
ncbi:transposase [Methanohalobium sp.]|uniref:transposase n=1 Tax=Methanohalobium sp. TaxID=2837493 RepID=UPI0025D14A4A|nr:transposase [Methanohalobium sp.]